MEVSLDIDKQGANEDVVYEAKERGNGCHRAEKSGGQVRLRSEKSSHEHGCCASRLPQKTLPPPPEFSCNLASLGCSTPSYCQNQQATQEILPLGSQ